MNDTVVIEFH